MNQRKKSALLGILFLAALVSVGTGIAVEDDTGVDKDVSSTGAATVENKLPGTSEQPEAGSDVKSEGAPAGKPSQASGDSTLPKDASDTGAEKLPGEEETPTVEAKPEGLPPDSAQETQAPERTSDQETEALAVPITQPGEDAESMQQNVEETAGEGEATAPAAETVQPPEPIEPDFVRALTGIAAGRNDSNPVWSPSGEMIAFERSIGDNREIVVARSDGSIVQRIQCRPADDDGEMEFFMPGILEETSYNAGISWSPDESRLVFMSNGGSGNYDLYLLPALGKEKTIRLTDNTEKDSHPHWSPVEERLAFVSGRTGKAEIYLMDLVSRKVSVLTNGTKTYLYPQWSPDGRKLALIYGSNENHDIYLIDDLKQPLKSMKALTTWEYDDLRPAWSPDGSKIAFYSNYNPTADPKVWSIIVVAANGSDPASGEELATRVVAHDVVPDVERGPAWMPDSRRIVFVKNDPKMYNPIYITHIENPSEMPLRTETRMNHDVVCSKNGTLAFRSQTEQWDHIYITRLKEEAADITRLKEKAADRELQ